MSKEPWELTPDESGMEFQPLFGGDERYSLSEADVSLENYPFFSLGKVIAFLHSHGLMHNDLHQGNVLYESWTGLPTLIDFGESRILDTPDPGVMANEFIGPFSRFNRNEFIAFLAGYVRDSHLHNDPKCTGYTDTLLGMIGGTATRHPRPRINRWEVQKIGDDLGCKFELDKDGIRLALVDQGQAWQMLDTDPEAFFFLLVGMLLVGIDFSHLFSLEDSSLLPNSQAGKHFFNLLSGYFSGKPVSGALGNGIGAADIALSLLLDLQGQGVDLKANTEHPNFTAFIRLVRLLRELGLTAQSVSAYCDTLVDVVDAFMRFADATPDGKRISINLGQMALMFLQYSPRDIEMEESRNLSIEQTMINCSWFPELLKPGHDSGFFYQELTFSRAKCNLDRQIFLYSADQDSPLYSYIWDAIRLGRTTLQSISDFLQADLSPDSYKALNQIASMTAKGHFGSLKNLYENFVTKLSPENISLFLDPRTNDPIFKNEIDWIMKLIDYLETHAIETPSGKKLLEGIREYVK